MLTTSVFNHTSDFAAVVMATFISRAVVVFGALDLEAPDLFVLRVAKEAVLARANRLAIDGLAVGVATAQDRSVARTPALGLAVGRPGARQPVAALGVRPAPGLLDADAVAAHLAGVALGAVGARRPALAVDALLRGQTVAAALAFRHADAADARVRRRALGVGGAQHERHAALVRTAGESGLARADGAVVDWFAVAVGAAGGS